ncbi:hypothetical protein N7540_007850 [Penicillium herquei]|nr:hypothetical protein N7540_007850 [Penicillium herquei]
MFSPPSLLSLSPALSSACPQNKLVRSSKHPPATIFTFTPPTKIAQKFRNQILLSTELKFIYMPQT